VKSEAAGGGSGNDKVDVDAVLEQLEEGSGTKQERAEEQ
jgi:hypothetical protein